MLLSAVSPQRCSRCLVKAKRRELQARRMRITTEHATPKYAPPKISHPFPIRRHLDKQRYEEITSNKFRRTPTRGRRNDAGRSEPLELVRSTPRGYLSIRPVASFETTLEQQLKALEETEKSSRFIQSLAERKGESTNKFFARAWHGFTSVLQPRSSTEKPLVSALSRPPALARAYVELKKAFADKGARGVTERLSFVFHDYLMGGQFSAFNVKMQKELADLRHPSEWYAKARIMQRTVHLHVGPTNSGKTYQALKKLEQVQNKGTYAGPLRLLAHEIYQRMNAKGIPTSLITGDDRRAPDGEVDIREVKLAACTVEMLPRKTTLDVCVVDEIQMIADPERGWAWTQAVLGVRASELHLCGEERTVPLIEMLVAATGDKLHIHRYKRLSALKVADKSLNGNLNLLEKGDCIVCFSVQGIHAMKKQIEERTGSKVAIVYGSLPPETRAQQARLFNDPDSGYDFLVASDAVGMGLNLAIKRVIFESMTKNTGNKIEALDTASIKQIAGRAGRYRTAAQGTDANATAPETAGLVTTIDSSDFPTLKNAMESEPAALQQVVIGPPDDVVERFATYFPPNTPFAYIIVKLHELCVVNKAYRLLDLKDFVITANLIEPVVELSISQRYTICKCPSWRDDDNTFAKLVPVLAKLIADHSPGSLTEIKEIPLEVLDDVDTTGKKYLRKLENLHKSLVLYLWLSYQFEGTLKSRALAVHVKTLVEEKLERALAAMQYADRNLVLEQRRQRFRSIAFTKNAEAAEVQRTMEQSSSDVPPNMAFEGASPVEMSEQETDVMPDQDAEQLAEYGDSSEPRLDDVTSDQDSGSLGELAEEGSFPSSACEQNTDYSEVQVSDQHGDTSHDPAVQSSTMTNNSDSTSSFAAWRNGQVAGEGQGTQDPEQEEDYVKRVTSTSV